MKFEYCFTYKRKRSIITEELQRKLREVYSMPNGSFTKIKLTKGKKAYLKTLYKHIGPEDRIMLYNPSLWCNEPREYYKMRMITVLIRKGYIQKVNNHDGGSIGLKLTPQGAAIGSHLQTL